MHCCNWQLLFALLLLTILYASLQLTMFVCIIFLLHFLNVPLEMKFLVCPSFELLKLPTFQWLQLNVFMDYFEWYFVYASPLQLTHFCMNRFTCLLFYAIMYLTTFVGPIVWTVWEYTDQSRSLNFPPVPDYIIPLPLIIKHKLPTSPGFFQFPCPTIREN